MTWQTALAVVGGIAGAGLVLWPVGIWWEVRKCEKPIYTVIRPLGNQRSWLTGHSVAELRQYAPMLIAEVTVRGTMRESSSAGFRKIANFIFGNNSAAANAPSGSGKQGEAIAMTSPVRMQLQGATAGAAAPTSSGSGSTGGSKIAMTSPVRFDMGASEVLAEGDAPGAEMRMSFVMPSKYTKESLPRPNNPDVVIREVPGHTAAALQFRGRIRSRAVVEAKKQELLLLLQAEGLAPVGNVTLSSYYPPFTYPIQRVHEVMFEVQAATASS